MLRGTFEEFPVRVFHFYFLILPFTFYAYKKSPTNSTKQFQAWQSFGYGMRTCIGRAFASQEAQPVLARISAKFDVFLADPGFTLYIKEALSIKTKTIMMRVKVALRSRHERGCRESGERRGGWEGVQADWCNAAVCV